MHQQLYDHFDSILSSKQCDSRKGHSAQHCLTVVLIKLKKLMERRGKFETLLTE